MTDRASSGQRAHPDVAGHALWEGATGVGEGESGLASRAYRALSECRFVDSLGAFRKMAERGSRQPEVFRQMGRTYHMFGRFAHAFDAYGRAAELFDAQSRQEHVREMLETMSRLQSEEISRQAKLAELLVKLGKEDRAVEKVEECAAGLLRERGDMDSFLTVATRILELGPEHATIRRRIADIIVTESGAFVRYNLHDRAERLLETVLEYCPDYHDVRERLADVLFDDGKPEEGVDQLLRLARHSEVSEEEAERLLKRACRHGRDGGRVREVAEEMGLEFSEVELCDREKGWKSGTAGLDEQTEPKSDSLDFDDVSTATDLEPLEDLEESESESDSENGEEVVQKAGIVNRRSVSSGGDGADDGEEAESEPAEPAEPSEAEEGEVEERAWDEDVITLDEESHYRRLMALLWYLEEEPGGREVRLRDGADREVARLAVQSGRLMPALVIDGEVYVDEGLGQKHPELADGLAESEADLAEALGVIGEKWSPALRGPLRQMVARGIVELVGREEELTVESRPSGEGFEARASFSAFSLLRRAASRMQGSGGEVVRAFYEEVRGEEVEAWMMAREPRQLTRPIWLPVRLTSEARGVMEVLDDISQGVEKIIDLAEAVRAATGGNYPVVSSVTDVSSKWVFLQTRWHIVCVRIEGNRLGTVLKRAAGFAEDFAAESQPETDAE